MEPVPPDYMMYGPTEEEMGHPRTMEMPIEDVNNLDEVVRELGIESSDTTPAEAVRELKAKNDRLQKALYELVHVAFPRHYGANATSLVESPFLDRGRYSRD